MIDKPFVRMCCFSSSLEYHSNMVSEAVKKVIKQGKVRDIVMPSCLCEWQKIFCGK